MIAVIVILLIIGLASAIFFGSAYIAAYADIKSRPREEMMFCNKHGHFRKGLCLPLGGVLYCPQCYLESIQNAAKELKK